MNFEDLLTHNLSRLWGYFDQINKACGARADDEGWLASIANA